MEREIRRWFDALVQAQPGPVGKGLILVASVALTLALATLRLALEIHLAVSLAPLLPVVLIVSWYLGMAWGVGIALFIVCAWLLPDLVGTTPSIPHSLAYINAAVRAGVLGLVAVLVAALRAAYRVQQELATTDALTGLANRRSFTAAVEAERQRGMRLGHPVTVAFLDLDEFKAVNDRYGHAAGDALLRLVGQYLRKRVRGIDCAARLGGDEYALLLPGTGPDDGRRAVAGIWQGLLATLAQHSHSVGVSAGAATFLRMPPTVDEMLNAADALMYRAKRAGGGRLEHDVMSVPMAPQRIAMSVPGRRSGRASFWTSGAAG